MMIVNVKHLVYYRFFVWVFEVEEIETKNV